MSKTLHRGVAARLFGDAVLWGFPMSSSVLFVLIVSVADMSNRLVACSVVLVGVRAVLCCLYSVRVSDSGVVEGSVLGIVLNRVVLDGKSEIVLEEFPIGKGGSTLLIRLDYVEVQRAWFSLQRRPSYFALAYARFIGRKTRDVCTSELQRRPSHFVLAYSRFIGRKRRDVWTSELHGSRRNKAGSELRLTGGRPVAQNARTRRVRRRRR